MLPNYSIFSIGDSKIDTFLEAVLNLFRDRLRPMFEADWSPRYAVNSGLLTKIKGFKMRDRGSIWPEHTCLQ